ncbi:alpha/beta hydrolase [Flavitalea sp. BT771]|uniref:alpha/beta fold hydrolase n=1 Tax=Flavitalea sp. BT771 TaxID=3063329 RepID=UPI0026E35162|nr:alpha/beta hydrolase [Flavitalea sp. BT771]MDO6430014.1 alpha/beta hydrolase [Flavitalea sp. BT771]MDV6217859.1 alpha/beta hydrolase [Flavitalea sp. BT771]
MENGKKKPSIVFCHGIWADGSCWSKLIPTLQEEGYEVIACQYTLQTVAEDVDIVEGSLGRVSSPAILVGHSYGGSVITAAGADDRVAGLVYIAALWPDSDETSQSQQDKYPRTNIWANVEIADGRAWMKHSGTEFFCGDLSAEEQRLVWATHFAPNVNLFNTTAHGTAWKTKPSWYIVATNDKTVHPQLQRDGAKKMGANTFEVASSHVPMLSKPEFVLDVIRKATAAVESSQK